MTIRTENGDAATVASTEASTSRPQFTIDDEEDIYPNSYDNDPHSLPSPDEIRSSHEFRPEKSYSVWLVMFGLFALAALIIGLAVGIPLSNDRHKQDQNTISPPTIDSKDRRDQVVNYLVSQGISSKIDFDLPANPQARAADFMAFLDDLQLNLPEGDKQTRDGYAFITRYVMAVWFYATGGPNWNFNLLFLSEHHTCDWFFIFGPPIGRVGVLCNPNTLEILGLSFSK